MIHAEAYDFVNIEKIPSLFLTDFVQCYETF